jgi:hypothetical protein
MLRVPDRPPPAPKRSRPRPLVGVAAVLGALLAGALAAIIVITSGRTSSGRALITGTAAGTRGLDVLPFPRTPDASPDALIAFPALLPAEIRSVSVTGSRSGVHHGRLEALPGGRGTAFVPRKPLAPGERVRVKAQLSSPAAGTASGAPEKTRLRYSFTVARPVAATAGTTGAPTATTTASAKALPAQSFHSEPDLHPPSVKVVGSQVTGMGDVFLTAQDSTQQGPMILNGKGQLIWFDPMTNQHTSAFNLRVQHYHRKPVLTWWQGRVLVPAGYGIDGEDVIVNQRLQTVAVLHAGEGYSSDLHEFQLTQHGTALITAFAPVKTDLSSVGGPKDGTVLDGVIEELDVKTGRVLWSWHALGHVPLPASHAGKPTPGQPYDYFHINSIEQLPDGNLLISARNTWAVYEISRTTGKVVWTLGGKDSEFTMDPGTNFEWQHDARLHRDGILTLFDDAATPKEEPQSRALRLTVDTDAMKVGLKRAYTHQPAAIASAEGSAQLLPNGDIFVGWGTDPDFSEYTPSGKQVWNGSFSGVIQSYRAYRFHWHSQSARPPAIALSAGSGSTITVYASWNGATQVARWQLLAGPSASRLAPLKTVARSGFETAIAVQTPQRYFAVRALSSAGGVLGTSRVVSRP